MPTAPSVLLAEKSALRDELKHLKLCQLNYFTISVTATGALLGLLGTKLGGGTAPTPTAFFFAPLVIVLPCWWIFFDKASTIARMVGYLTVLDWLLSDQENDVPGFRYLAWEAALRHYRQQRPRTLRERFRQWLAGLSSGVARVLTFQTTHRYWSINWYTYALLSAICWLLGSNVLVRGFASIRTWSVESAVLVAIIVSAVFNLYLSGELVAGRLSYAAHCEAWKEFLRPEKVTELIAKESPGR